MDFNFLRLFFLLGLFAVLNISNNCSFAEEHSDKEHSEEGVDEHKDDEHKDDEHEHGHEEQSSDFGPGRAILAVREEGNSFKLSEESLQFLKIKFQLIVSIQEKKISSDGGLFEVPLKALASFQSDQGVFIQEGEWVELVHVKIERKSDGKAFVRSKALKSNSIIAVEGVHFLRTAQLAASGQGGEGHAH